MRSYQYDLPFKLLGSKERGWSNAADKVGTLSSLKNNIYDHQYCHYYILIIFMIINIVIIISFSSL